MTSVILVKGTFGGPWADPGSPFRASVLAPAGVDVFDCVDYWSGDVDGLWRWLTPFTRDKYADWRIGGAFLAWVLRSLPYDHRNIISHSHGLHVCAYAAERLAAQSERIRSLVDVCGPVRADTRAVCQVLHDTCDRWVHVASKGGDRMQLFGELFDGAVGWVREHPCAHQNVTIEGIGHSRLLSDAQHFPKWTSEQLLAVFTDAGARVASLT